MSGPPLTSSDVEAVDVRWSAGTTTGDVTVVVESDGGVRERMVLALVEEDGSEALPRSRSIRRAPGDGCGPPER